MADDDLKARVETVLRAEVAPALELDGAAIEVIEVIDGVARVRLNGACAGCPATIWTLINGIEQELREGAVQDIRDERALARPRHTGHRDEAAQREGDIDVAEVVLARAANDE